MHLVQLTQTSMTGQDQEVSLLNVVVAITTLLIIKVLQLCHLGIMMATNIINSMKTWRF